jgi:XTP/dITP diphosphohydrolase
LLASSNIHKATEFRRLLAGSPLRLRLPADLGVPGLDVPEPSTTFAGNALAKAIAYLQAYRMPALADDSGISVDALAGAPGVRSARFGDAALDDAGRTAYLLACLRGIPARQRGAHYTCCLVLARPEQAPLIVHGLCYGTVAERSVPGPTGFGYDPIFVVPSMGSTVSQLTAEQKDVLGHRGKAVRALLACLACESAASGTLEE